jgi:hypothetical protein
MWVAIHKCMEAMLGISLYSYLYLKLAETLCLPYYLYVFSLTKSVKRRVEQIQPGTGDGWRGKMGGCGDGEVAQTMYTHVNK